VLTSKLSALSRSETKCQLLLVLATTKIAGCENEKVSTFG